MKTIGVKFINKGIVSDEVYSFICPDEFHDKLSKGTIVVVDTRYGPSLGKVVILDWKCPPVQPFKCVIDVITSNEIDKSSEREEIVRKIREQQEKEKLENERKKQVLAQKMANIISKNYTAGEIATIIGVVSNKSSLVGQALHQLAIQYNNLFGNDECEVLDRIARR